MKNLERYIDVDDNSTSPRLKDFKGHLIQWLEQYNDDDSTDEGINMVILGTDKKFKDRIIFSLTGKTDPVSDIFNAFNKGFGMLDDEISRDIYSGMCEYLIALFTENPELYKMFEENYKLSKEDYENRIQKVSDSVQ